jgi:hypothetical protein
MNQDTFKLSADAYLVGEYKPKISIKGYVAEAKLRRILQREASAISAVLNTKYGIRPYRYLQTPQTETIQFHCTEDLCSKLRALDAKICIDLLQIYEENGILVFLDHLLKLPTPSR